MNENFSEERYQEMIQKLFVRFPSFQKVGAGAYKPGMANMEFADQLMGHPHRGYKIVHVAGTNGKGSVSNMLTSALAASGLKVGLYTSPHILDFRERIRVVSGSFTLIPKEDVWSFVQQWRETFDHLDMSFFEITTLMALDWFSKQKVDVVVLETGLGGRLDSTNIVTPVLSVITNIGLDHCDMLGDTLSEIAFEKAGIIKPKVPVVVGESHPETDPVFERKVLYTNLPEPSFMGNRNAIMSLLTFADKTEPALWEKSDEILAGMDLQGSYQKKNLRTVLAALEALSRQGMTCGIGLKEALMLTAARTGFRGRWEKISDAPYTICDIGHNEHGLKYNFAQLTKMVESGEFTHLIIVYGSVADKDVDAVMHLMPENAIFVFTQASGKRALPAGEVTKKYLAFCAASGRKSGDVHAAGTVVEAMRIAEKVAASIVESDAAARPMIYVGGSTYVVSEAVASRV
ncbi:MAG: bifunctional folylpolyglutamate synthase/dihydrofolate synthase [Bacteroidales bacterium]|nr:bifunctional folylpolyglutamate synthase/dihydrofolate synthase [Bacteroidales bacterium]